MVYIKTIRTIFTRRYNLLTPNFGSLLHFKELSHDAEVLNITLKVNIVDVLTSAVNV